MDGFCQSRNVTCQMAVRKAAAIHCNEGTTLKHRSCCSPQTLFLLTALQMGNTHHSGLFIGSSRQRPTTDKRCATQPTRMATARAVHTGDNDKNSHDNQTEACFSRQLHLHPNLPLNPQISGLHAAFLQTKHIRPLARALTDVSTTTTTCLMGVSKSTWRVASRVQPCARRRGHLDRSSPSSI